MKKFKKILYKIPCQVLFFMKLLMFMVILEKETLKQTSRIK